MPYLSGTTRLANVYQGEKGCILKMHGKVANSVIFTFYLWLQTQYSPVRHTHAERCVVYLFSMLNKNSGHQQQQISIASESLSLILLELPSNYGTFFF